MEPLTIVCRIGLAGILAGIIGWERESHGRSAGLRTNVLVGMAGAMFMIISMELYRLFPNLDSQSVLRLDPGRIASYTVAGMGFMGAGVILKGRSDILGVTTAACLWVNTAVGLAVGCGLYLASIVLTGFTMITLIVFQFSKRWVSRDMYTRIAVYSDDRPGQRELLEETLLAFRSKILFIGYSQDLESHTINFRVSVRMKKSAPWKMVADKLAQIE